MKPSKIFFLLLLLALGTSVETAWRVRSQLDFGPFGWRVLGGKFYGPSFTFEETRSAAVAAGGTVVVANEFGGVRVSRGDVKEVQVHLRKVVYLPTDGAARAVADRVKIAVDADGGTLRVSTNRGDLERDGALRDAGLETHFALTLPPGIAVQVKNEHGRIDVADVTRADIEGSFEPITVERVAGDAAVRGRHGEIQVSSVGGQLTLWGRHGDIQVHDGAGATAVDVEHGDVKLERVGALTLSLKHGDLEVETVAGNAEVKAEHSAVKVAHVAGDARVATTFEDVHLEDVSGDAEVKTEHGAIEASKIKGAVRVEASFDGVSLTDIGGHADVKVDHGGLHARGLAKGATIQVAGDDADLEGFRGSVRVEARRGNVRLAPGGPLTEPLSATTDHGAITLEVEPASHFDLSASARPGSVEVRLTDFASSDNSASRSTGRVGGGGAAVVLDAQHGDVTVEPRAPETAAKDN